MITPQDQNLAIAKACGWRLADSCCCTQFGYPPGERRKRRMPFYTTNLNAMAQAEATLTPAEATIYVWNIETAVAGPCDTKVRAVMAPAHVRAKCWLKAKGLWREQ